MNHQRVTVALSRVRYGMRVIGAFQLLQQQGARCALSTQRCSSPGFATHDSEADMASLDVLYGRSNEVLGRDQLS
ncbi:unnamed protein product [Gongylonema pulchrum]|uniref:Isochorismatase domain-containing protein n=1 Tax=Gongylonema pulchrum TaxID=637853 RepID=A0A183EB18_9BILA|nr:unnamed protein product [Gongylonema pulchrum]